MKFFIDTANFEEIKEAYEWGIIDGVRRKKEKETKIESKII